MKYFILFSILFFTIISCKEDCLECPNQNQQNTNNGKLVLKSLPSGARIYLLGTDTGKLTPDSIQNLEAGDYEVALHLTHYDTAYFIATIFPNLTTTKEITLVDSLPPVEFDWIWSIGGNGIRFQFLTNQDILMDSITVERPTDSDGSFITEKHYYTKEVFAAYNQWGVRISYFMPPDSTYYPYFRSPATPYRFYFYGQKAYGTQAYFYIFYQNNG
jgi:hypothetical protein